MFEVYEIPVHKDFFNLKVLFSFTSMYAHALYIVRNSIMRVFTTLDHLLV